MPRPKRSSSTATAPAPEVSPVLTGELELKYIPLNQALLFSDNPKLHDIGAIAQSIEENGFRDPPLWDTNLNGGSGGIVAGNGRTEALAAMWGQGRTPPRGIAVDKAGEWHIPIVFGCDATSEAQARKFVADHNNLTMAGGSFTALDMSRMYDKSLYVKYLEQQQKEDALPNTVDADDLALLVRLSSEDGALEFDDPYADESESNGSVSAPKAERVGGDSEDDEDDDDDPLDGFEPDAPPESSVRMLQLFLNTETQPQVMKWIDFLNGVYETTNPTDCIYQVLKAEVERQVADEDA